MLGWHYWKERARPAFIQMADVGRWKGATLSIAGRSSSRKGNKERTNVLGELCCRERSLDHAPLPMPVYSFPPPNPFSFSFFFFPFFPLPLTRSAISLSSSFIPSTFFFQLIAPFHSGSALFLFFFSVPFLILLPFFLMTFLSPHPLVQ